MATDPLAPILADIQTLKFQVAALQADDAAAKININTLAGALAAIKVLHAQVVALQAAVAALGPPSPPPSPPVPQTIFRPPLFANPIRKPWMSVVWSTGGGYPAVSPPPPPGTIFTTITLQNTSGSTVSTNFLSYQFGHPFDQGRIPSGTYPQFQLVGGTVLKFTMWNQVYWPDGSLEFACFRFAPIPTTIAGSGSLTINVLTNGATPGALSGRTLTEVTAAAIKVVGVAANAAANLSGTWTADSGDRLSAVKVADGDAGAYWEIRSAFKQSGSAHGQLVCDFFIWALNDASANLAGFEFLTRPTQPYYNADTVAGAPAPNERVFSSLTIQYGAGPTTINPFPYTTAKTFTWSGSAGRNITCTAHGLPAVALSGGVIACPVQFTTTGTLPTGLSLNTTYYAACEGTPNSLEILQDSTCGINTNITSAGSGTHTITFYQKVNHFGSLFGAQSNAKYNYIQGAGSVANIGTVRTQFNNTYWRSTKVLPPWDLTISPTSNSSVTFDVVSANPLNLFLEETGGRDVLAEVSGIHARHFFTQAAVDEQVSLCAGLAQAHLCTHILDVTSGGMANVGDPGKSYTGLPSSLDTTLQWCIGFQNQISGFTIPSNQQNAFGGNLTQGFNENTEDHMHDFAFYPYLISGRQEFLRLLQEMAGQAIYSVAPANRNPTSPVTKFGIVSNQPVQMRSLAWQLREVIRAAYMSPASDPNGKQTKNYLVDAATDSIAFLNSYCSSINSYYTTNGLYAFPTVSDPPWQRAFIAMVMCHAYALSGSSAARTWLQNVPGAWFAHRNATDGSMWLEMGYYDHAFNDQGSGGFSVFITDEAHFGTLIPTWSLSWSSATNLFTISGQTWTIANGDKWIWGSTPLPGGLSQDTPYYAVQQSGSTFKLSATPGGSPITITDTNSGANNQGVYLLVVNPGTIGSAGGGNADGTDTGGYVAIHRCATRWMVALGITGLSSAQTSVDSFWTGTFTADPKFGVVATF